MEIYVEAVQRTHGLPELFVMDNGSVFTAQNLRSSYRKMGSGMHATSVP
jgi:hypothetical protein